MVEVDLSQMTDYERTRHLNRLAVQRYRAKNAEKIKQQRALKAEEARQKGREYYSRKKEEILSRGREYYQANKEMILDRIKKQKESKREEIYLKQRQARLEDPERFRIAERASKKRNVDKHRHKYANQQAERRALGRKTKWADKETIHAIYELAKTRSMLTGIAWHVDHIVPVKSNLVCGLHVEYNLQVIPREVNSSKCNRYWPNHPNQEFDRPAKTGFFG